MLHALPLLIKHYQKTSSCSADGAQRNPGYNYSREPLMCRHCEERSDTAISMLLIPLHEIATLRSQ